ncbi:MAG: molybdopterin cofactor-binding domain-containing protein [Pseudomonadota bacterium]
MSEQAQGTGVGKLARLTRRGFLATAGLVGGGLTLGITLAPNRLKMTSEGSTAGEQVLLNTWVKLTPDNQLTVLIPHSEMGQGAGTGLAQMLAEELDADWATVSIEDAPTTDAYTNSDLGRGYIIGEAPAIPGFMYPLIDFAFLQIAKGLVGQITGGSTAIRLTGHHGMRRAGAAAREMLVAAAADLWEVDPAQLTTRASQVMHAPSGRQITYGELASAAARYSPSLKPALKAPSDYTLVGQPVTRLDLSAKVDGSAQFGIDVAVPGMVYAAIALPEVRDARAVIEHDARARARTGVRDIINLGDVVAVVADGYWVANQALQDLTLRWEGGQPSLTSEQIRSQHLQDLEQGKLQTLDGEGDATSAMATGTALAADYAVPYLAHATMEPLNCTVHARPDGADLWVGHQNFPFARDAVAEELGLDPAQVTVHKRLLGGGFGRRGQFDYVTIAARIAARVPAPVKVIWSRENDMTNDTYRPAISAKLQGAVGDDGRISAFVNRYVYTDAGMPDSERPFALPYDVPARDIARVRCPSPIAVGAWRSVDFTQHGFFNESFIDELAHAAGADPLAFRLDHLSDPRMRAVLEKAGDAAGWGSALAPGRARGVALVKSFETIVAQVAEASVDERGDVTVHRVTSAVDCGLVINPDSARAQITGSVIFALSAALFGEITVREGRIQQRNFPDYRLLKLADAPTQEVHFLRGADVPGGLGEPGVPAVAPALTNAIFAATGKRLRELPIAPQLRNA